MPLPRWVAHLNKRATNRFIEPIVRRYRHYARIHHTGRVTGANYRTPVYAFPANGLRYVALTYGPGADWVRNAIGGTGWCESGGEMNRMEDLQIVDRSAAWPHLPAVIRAVLRILRVHHFAQFRLDVG